MKNNNVIYFSCYIDGEYALDYYSMLYYALHSLLAVYDNSFDIVVFYSFINCHDDFDQYMHLGKYNLKRDFPNVNFIKSDYIDNYETSNKFGNTSMSDPWMSKWFHLPKLTEMGYSKIFFIDCDVIFFKNPSYIFEYSTENIWSLGCGDKVFNILMPNRTPFASAAFVVYRTHINKIPNFYETVLVKRDVLNKKGIDLFEKGLIQQDELRGWLFFNEQFCAQLVFEDIDVQFAHMPVGDFGTCIINDFTTIRAQNETMVINLKNCSIIHYASSRSAFVLPSWIRTPTQQKLFNNTTDYNLL